MNILIVGCASSNSTTIKDGLENIIKAQSTWARLADNTYAVVTPLSAAGLRDKISDSYSQISRLYIYKVNNQEWASFNMPKEVNNWSHNNWSQS